MEQRFVKDASTQVRLRKFFAAHFKIYLIQLLFPIGLYALGPYLGRQYDLVLLYKIAVCGLIFIIVFNFYIGSSFKRGDTLVIGDHLLVQKKDGTSHVIERSAIQKMSVRPAQNIAIVWKDRGKLRALYLTRDGFVENTWKALVASAQAWSTKT